MQQLDTAVYAPLKTHWQDVCHHYLQSHPGKVITKYQFNQLFSEAWLKTMTPTNIVSGFGSCRVYPFNPKAVLDHDPCVSRSKNPKSSDIDLPSGSIPVIGEDDLHQPNNTDSDTTICRDENGSFTAEEEILYQTRYTEGYDLHDPKYISWLKFYHPDENCETFSLMECFPDASVSKEIPVVVSADDMTNEILPGSTPSRKDGGGSRNVSRSLVLETPITNESTSTRASLTSVVLSNSSTPLKDTSAASSVIHTPPNSLLPTSTISISTSSSTTTPISASSSSMTPVSTPTSCTTPISTSYSSMTPVSTSSTPRSSNMISKYLVQYVPVVQEKKKATETRITGSRVLTSAEGIAILREREEKKRKEKEEKERRKQERLNKKKEKDNLAKKKAEEKAKKIADKGKSSLPKRSRKKAK